MKAIFAPALVMLAALAFAPTAVQAKLLVPQATVRMKAAESDKTLTHSFVVLNNGQEPIEVLSVSTSCHCLSASIDKKKLAPGEAGSVAVSYDIGVNEGAITQTVTVLTNEATENAYTLTFKADLPPSLKGGLPPVDPVSPRLLYWMRKPFDGKTVTVDLKTVRGSKFTAVCDVPNAFRIETDAPAGSGTAKITVTPITGSGIVRGELTVTLETEDGKKVPYAVALRTVADKPFGTP